MYSEVRTAESFKWGSRPDTCSNKYERAPPSQRWQLLEASRDVTCFLRWAPVTSENTTDLDWITPAIEQRKCVPKKKEIINQPVLRQCDVFNYFYLAHECAFDWVWLWSCGVSSTGDGGASLRGGMRSLIASNPFASAKLVILWLGEKPCNAKRKHYFWPQ